MSKIELKSPVHRKIHVGDILPNPHRDFKANPIAPEKVEDLIESYERTGFWDNIVVREHPTREGKYEQAHGHNRLAALKDKRIIVDTITLPVAKLTDWDMYCAMVDENELSGKPTPAVVMENINVGCDLIEAALKKIGKSGTWEEFNETVGRVVSTDTALRDKRDGGFEQVREAFFRGEGIGRSFLAEFLPCGRIRTNTISEVINTRYGETRAKAKAEQAKEAAAEAAKAKAKADTETDTTKKAKANERAREKQAEAEKLEREAAKIGKGIVNKDVLLMFDASRTMTDFAEAVRKLGISKEHHAKAAVHVIKAKVKEERIARELSIWWDEVSGASAERQRAAKAVAEREKFKKKTKGRDYISVLLKLRDSIKNEGENWKLALAAVHLATTKEKNVIEQIANLVRPINALVERSREASGEVVELPAQKMLTHRR